MFFKMPLRSRLKSHRVIIPTLVNTSIMAYVRRITLFKIPSESDIDALLKAYDILKQTNKKVRDTFLPTLLLNNSATPERQALHPLLRRQQGVQHV